MNQNYPLALNLEVKTFYYDLFFLSFSFFSWHFLYFFFISSLFWKWGSHFLTFRTLLSKKNLCAGLLKMILLTNISIDDKYLCMI